MNLVSHRKAPIARDIDRLIEYWDVESVPRAVTSVAPEAGYWWKPRSLPLAVLIQTGELVPRAVAAALCQQSLATARGTDPDKCLETWLTLVDIDK